MKVAIVHEWFASYAGSERVVEQLLKIYPDADLYAVVDFLDDDERGFLDNKTVTTSFIQRLPFARKKFRQYLPLMPLAVEQLDVSNYDVVISSSHAVAKGVLTHPNQVHICYCHSPIRYAWDMQHQYLKDSGLDKGLKSRLTRLILHYIRIWDVRTAHGVDYFVANSRFIAKRIKKVYGRDATVIHPPVDVDAFMTLQTQKEDFYLAASRLVPYKKVSLVVEAFNSMPAKRLVVIGDGEDLDKIRSIARDNIEILGYQRDAVLKDYMARAKAFVFAAEEDFGIMPVEAQASGTPLIAYGRGGVLDIVRPGTGILFKEQSVASLIEAVEVFESGNQDFTAEACRDNALRFSRQHFRQTMQQFVVEALSRSSDN